MKQTQVNDGRWLVDGISDAVSANALQSTSKLLLIQLSPQSLSTSLEDQTMQSHELVKGTTWI